MYRMEDLGGQTRGCLFRAQPHCLDSSAWECGGQLVEVNLLDYLVGRLLDGQY